MFLFFFLQVLLIMLRRLSIILSGLVLFGLCGLILFISSIDVGPIYDGGPTPSPANVAKVMALSNHTVAVTTYTIPQVVFRGADWPTSPHGNFDLWIIVEGKDRRKSHYVPVPAPQGFRKNVTHKFFSYAPNAKRWSIVVKGETEKLVTYLVKNKDGSIAIQLEVPAKPNPYAFSILENEHGEKLLVFMNIAELIVDDAVFGYVEIKENNHS